MYATSHKRPFVPSVWVSDNYVMYRQRASQFCETSTEVTNWVIDPFVKSLWFEGGNFGVSLYCSCLSIVPCIFGIMAHDPYSFLICLSLLEEDIISHSI